MARDNNDRAMDWPARKPRSGRSYGAREDQGTSGRRDRNDWGRAGNDGGRAEEPVRIDGESSRHQRNREAPARRVRMRLDLSSDEDNHEPPRNLPPNRRRARADGGASSSRRNDPPSEQTQMLVPLMMTYSSTHPEPSLGETPPKKKGKKASGGAGARDSKSTELSPEGSSNYPSRQTLLKLRKMHRCPPRSLLPRSSGISIKLHSSATSEEAHLPKRRWLCRR